MTEQALKPEDGARFYGKIQQVEDGFRATCNVRNDLGGVRHEGRVMTHVSPNEGDARTWIKDIAEKLGFRSWINESPADR